MKKIKLNLKPMIKKFEVYTKRNTISELSGSYMSLFKGKGLEFADYRKYTSTDDSSKIDWKASVRAKELLIKEMMEERNEQVFILFDVGNSMLFASTDKLKCEYSAEIVASLAFTILRSNDSVGITMFSDKVNKMVPLSTGPQHYYKITKELNNPENYGGGFDLAKALRFANNTLLKNSVIVIISDFIGLGNSWESHFRIASKKFAFIFLIMVRDPVDNNLPGYSGQIALEDPYSSDKLIINPDSMRDNYNLNSKNIKEKIKNQFLELGCDTLEILTTESFDKAIANFSKRNRRRWR